MTPITIMVVEDEQLLLEAIGKKLKSKNINCILFSSAEKALDYLKTAPVLPSAIWLDYYLQEMNGLTFMTTIRSNEKLNNIPVVVVSNSATDEKVNNMLALGVKKYLLKAEHRLEDIINVIYEFVNEDKQNTASNPRKKILFIEDDPITIAAYRTKLTPNFETLNATTGDQGIRDAIKYLPDIIILDLLLPGDKNGHQVLHELKSNPQTQSIPVIVLTNLEGQLETVLNEGAAACYIKTDLGMDEILKKIHQYTA